MSSSSSKSLAIRSKMRQIDSQTFIRIGQCSSHNWSNWTSYEFRALLNSNKICDRRKYMVPTTPAKRLMDPYMFAQDSSSMSYSVLGLESSQNNVSAETRIIHSFVSSAHFKGQKIYSFGTLWSVPLVRLHHYSYLDRITVPKIVNLCCKSSRRNTMAHRNLELVPR